MQDCGIAHKSAAEKLLLFSKALDEAADGIQITDLTGHVIYSNQAVETIYGYSPEEYLGRHVNEMNADPEFAGQVILPSILRDGRWAGELPVKHKNGKIFPIWLSTSLVTGEDGQPMAMIGIIRDITELKLATEALREQLLFTNAVNSITETIISNSNTGEILQKMAHIVGETLEVDRSLIYDVNLETNVAAGLCEWDKADNPQMAPTRQNWNLDLFRSVVKFIMENRTWLESHVDDINPYLLKDGLAGMMHREMGAKSLLYYPFSFHKTGFYLLVFHQVSRRRDWRNLELDFIGAVAKHVEVAVQKLNFLAERQRAEQEIWEEKERAQVTLQSIGDAVITTDLLGNVEYINPVAEDLTGWSAAQAIGRPLAEVFNIVDEETGKQVDNPVIKCIREGRIVGLANHTELVHKDGHRFAIEDSASPIKNRMGATIGAVLVFHNVSEKRDMLRQMAHQAYHDSLTGLPNRVLFNDRLSLAMAQAHRNHEMLAVMFLDLDRFKQVNDMMGHAKGDALLKHVAGKLLRCLRDTDTVARLGGDEFAILLPRFSHLEDIAKTAQKIISCLDHAWKIDEQEFHITASLGIALYPSDGDDPETLLKHADTAMYRAKDRGRNNYQLYTPAMNTRITERLKMENDLRHALQRGEFRVFYQPQVNFKTGKVVGIEALVRWQHPERGLIPPAEFIPMAEETGLIVPMGEWVLLQACTANMAWQKQGFTPTKVSVNISACQFGQRNLTGTVARILKTTGLEPKWLELEITESALMKDVDSAIKILNDLTNMGVNISIDDFGTGYSSLAYLKRFPIHTLKIDRSFIKDVATDAGDAAIVSTVISMAQNLNLKVIAEGVETEEQLSFLEQRQCNEVQGFLFSRPVPPEDLEELLKKGFFGPGPKLV